MKKILKIGAILFAALFILIQFIRPDLTNPSILPGQTLEESTGMPAEVQMVIARSCNDCHSNKTVYPWYARVTPFNWFLNSHIQDGRKEMNFSLWNTYSLDKKIRTLDEICEQVEAEQMPLPSYLWIHQDAVLGDSQRKLLCDWATSEKGRLEQP